MHTRGQSEEVEYYRRRALEEQVAAAKTRCEEARKAHDELAMLYRFKAVMLSSKPDSWADCLNDEDQAETV